MTGFFGWLIFPVLSLIFPCYRATAPAAITAQLFDPENKIGTHPRRGKKYSREFSLFSGKIGPAIASRFAKTAAISLGSHAASDRAAIAARARAAPRRHDAWKSIMRFALFARSYARDRGVTQGITTFAIP
jgi:hypothetical protein